MVVATISCTTEDRATDQTSDNTADEGAVPDVLSLEEIQL
jgi:hypothetical protein